LVAGHPLGELPAGDRLGRSLHVAQRTEAGADQDPPEHQHHEERSSRDGELQLEEIAHDSS